MELGLQDPVLKIGNLKTERVVIDVRDCVNAYYLLMLSEESRGGVFNVCGNEVHQMQKYTDLLIEHSKFDYDQVWAIAKDACMEHIDDEDKAS